MAGFFGSISKTPCITDVFYGTDYHSHLGTRRAGIATYDAATGNFRRVIHSISSATFRVKMEPELPKFLGNAGIGIISDTDAQPLLFNSHLGRFALSTVGKIANLDELAAEALKSNMHLSEFSSGRVNPTELVGLMIISQPTLVEGIRYAQQLVKGSLSLILLTEDGIVCARDSWGRTPVIIGHKEGAYCAVSESSSFHNLGYEPVRDLGPGEIVRLRADGEEQLAEPLPDHLQICSFLWVYYGFPTSAYEGRNVEDVRNYIGFAMGKEDPTEVDCCCGVPDSGIGMAIGYSEGHGVRYRRAISKYTPTWSRSFMPVNQDMRNLVAKMKLIQNDAILRDRRVLLCDDSIVRGTQLHDNVHCLLEGGVKEIHMRTACPPLLYGCPFINFSESKSVMELITRRAIAELEGEEAALDDERVKAYAVTDSPEYKRMVELIAGWFGLNSLKFTKLETLIKAIGLPRNHICTHCFDGSSSHTLS
ncbi:MAG: amidophosphoribosyltransferase [Paludibacteraceae bacterium]|nr:amidophosphoribosyltransferase [Paludibacteraceae bacterium]